MGERSKSELEKLVALRQYRSVAESVARTLEPKKKKFKDSPEVLQRILTTLLRDLARHGPPESPALAEEVLRYMLGALVTVDMLHCNAVLDVFQQKQDWQRALDMLQKMDAVLGLPPGVDSFNTAMGACVKAQQRLPAMKLLYAMPGRQLQPDTISFNMGISAAGSWEETLVLLQYMSKVKVPRSAVSFGSALDSLLREGDTEDWPWALQLLEDLQEDMPMTEIHVSQAMLVCEAAGRWDLALELLKQKPASELCCSTAITCCNRHEQFRVAQKLFQSRSDWTEVKFYNTGMVAYAKDTRWEEVLRVMHQMALCSLQPDDTSRDIALAGASQAGQWRLALHFVGRSQRQICLAIAACGHGQREDLALEILRGMSAKGLEANVQAYNTAISACEKTANWQAAFQLFAEMISKEVDVTEVTYGALISACEKADEASLALSCLQSALTVSLADEKSFNPAILVCSRNSFWPQALELFAQLPARQLASKADSYNAVLDGLGTSPTAMKIFREALEKQIYPNLLYESLLDLHELSASSAKLATCWFLAEVLPKRRPWPKRFRPGIIVGQELHSPSSRRAESAGTHARVRPAVEELLRELHIDFKVKAGRVFLTLDGVDPKSLKSLFPP